MRIFRIALMLPAMLYVKYLQSRYKRITINIRTNQTNRILGKLQLIQSKLYYFENEFSPWGYFHPSPVYGIKYEKFLKSLFPPIDFKELEIIVWYNPRAVTYYRNKIWESGNKNVDYAKEIVEFINKPAEEFIIHE